MSLPLFPDPGHPVCYKTRYTDLIRPCVYISLSEIALRRAFVSLANIRKPLLRLINNGNTYIYIYSPRRGVVIIDEGVGSAADKLVYDFCFSCPSPFHTPAHLPVRFDNDKSETTRENGHVV